MWQAIDKFFTHNKTTLADLIYNSFVSTRLYSDLLIYVYVWILWWCDIISNWYNQMTSKL